jgi:hypothetical protein
MIVNNRAYTAWKVSSSVHNIMYTQQLCNILLTGHEITSAWSEHETTTPEGRHSLATLIQQWYLFYGIQVQYVVAIIWLMQLTHKTSVIFFHHVHYFLVIGTKKIVTGNGTAASGMGVYYRWEKSLEDVLHLNATVVNRIQAIRFLGPAHLFF